MDHQACRTKFPMKFTILMVALGSIVLRAAPVNAVDSASAISYISTAASALKALNSLFDGTDRQLAKKLDDVKADLIEEMYKIDAKDVADDVRSLVDRYREISENPTMTGIEARFVIFLDKSLESFNDLERRLSPDDLPLVVGRRVRQLQELALPHHR